MAASAAVGSFMSWMVSKAQTRSKVPVSCGSAASATWKVTRSATPDAAAFLLAWLMEASSRSTPMTLARR